MNVLGVTVNRPSDGKERAVADGVVFLGPRPHPEADGLTLSAPKTITVGSKSHAVIHGRSPDRISNINVVWGCTGACAIDQEGNLRALAPGLARIQASVQGRVLSARVTVTPPKN